LLCESRKEQILDYRNDTREKKAPSTLSITKTRMSASLVPFERYDDEFQSLVQQVQQSLQESDDLDFTSSLLQQCDDLLKQMAIEARGVDNASAKRDLLAQVRTCKSQLAALKSDYSIQLEQAQKSNLFSGSSSATKERLLENEELMQKQQESLDRARNVMADTESVAMEITTELSRNRETMESAHGRVKQVSGLTNRARRLLQNMNRRRVQQKLALYSISLIIVIVVMILLWNLR
jgi:vesicle transport through interaction with t-SNAREs protein 1